MRYTLGVLDQSPVRSGGTAADALRESVRLAQAAERLGYARYWVAEHHNTDAFAGTTPEVLIGQIAAATSSIHVGSGGVMLSHYSALKVAETFRVLCSFYPGRIEVGVGRAPGSDPVTALALVHPKAPTDVERDYPQQVLDLLGYLSGGQAEGHPFDRIHVQPGPPPAPDDVPAVWLLGSSDYSARLAALLGLPYAFADFFGDRARIGPRVARLYRDGFRPSPRLDAPRLCVAVQVYCADNREDARRLALSYRYVRLLRRQGRPAELLPPEEVEARLTPPERAWLAGDSGGALVGDPDAVSRDLLAVAERYGADDLNVVTNCHDFADRLRSYELVAAACGLTPG